MTVDVLYIGYPKAASTYLRKYLAGHPDAFVTHQYLAQILYHPGFNPIALKVPPGKVSIAIDESIVESVCVTGDPTVWSKHQFKSGAFNLVAKDVVLDPAIAAKRLAKHFPNAKVLMVIRDPVTWFESIFKYVVSQLAPNERTFKDWWSCPQGLAMRMAADHELVEGAYRAHFKKVEVMPYEMLNTAWFHRRFCDYLAIRPLPFPSKRENAGNGALARLHQWLPFLSSLPHPVKSRLKPLAAALPGRNGSLLSKADKDMIREIYGVYPDLQSRSYAPSGL